MTPKKGNSAEVLQGGRDVHGHQNIENGSAITQYFQTKLAVVEVRRGESQDDAWRRYLVENPGSAGVHVKIFHYPEPSPLKRNSEIRSEFPLPTRREKLA